MTIIEMFKKELEQEALTTRKMFACIPDDKYDWQPHPKSMTIKRLVAHIAELPTWITLAFTTDELDFATNPYTPEPLNNTAELLAYFEKCLEDGRTQLGVFLRLLNVPIPGSYGPSADEMGM